MVNICKNEFLQDLTYLIILIIKICKFLVMINILDILVKN